MKSLKERTEIQQAYLDGQQIEFKNELNKSNYHDVGDNCAFARWLNGDYRIKSEPMEIWVMEFETGTKMIIEDGYVATQPGVIKKYIEAI